jgi:PII-like signaling protein
MMPDPVEVERLRRRDLEKYDNPDGPTFDQLVQQWKNKGLSGDEVYEAIIGSSQRTDRDVNKRFNLE